MPSVKIGILSDDPDSLLKNSILDGLTYNRIGNSPTDAATRITWLNKQPADHLGNNFKPQPWEQLIKVLREMGHTADADEVAIEKQNALYRAGKIQGFDCVWHLLYKYLAGYGYRPSITLTWMFVIWFILSHALSTRKH